MSITSNIMQPPQVLTPRLYFDGLVVVCTLTLGATLAVQSLVGMPLSELGRFQQWSYIALILLGSLGILLGGTAQRGRRGQGVVALCTLALLANFTLACLLMGVSLSPASTVAPLDIWRASWNGTIALVLVVVSLATLMRWQRG